MVIQPMGDRETYLVMNVYGPQRMDYKLILEDLMLTNKEMIAIILPFGGSDHWPVQLEVQGIGTPKNKPFRFENI